MSLQIGLLVFPKIQQLDLTGPYEVFRSASGIDVHLVWKDREPVISSSGLTFTPTITMADCPQLDVICVPGGAGMNALMLDDETLDFIRLQSAQARYITSVCTGSLVLGAAGLLEGKRAASHWNARDLLAGFGAIPTNERIVRDGNVITAGGVTSGIDFGLLLIAELIGQQEAEVVQLSLEYAPQPPFQSGLPEGASPEVLATAKQRAARARVEAARTIK